MSSSISSVDFGYSIGTTPADVRRVGFPSENGS